MSTVTVHIRNCPACGKEFRVSGRAACRKKYCGSKECKRAQSVKYSAKYRSTAKGKAYRKEWVNAQYNPWKWENTILEWWE